MVQGSSTIKPRKALSRALPPKALVKKREILEAASRVFRRQGLYATRMRDIAAEIGMQVGNLYYYFENRQELLAFCQRDALEGLLDLAAWVERQELPASGKLYLLVLGHVVHVNEGTPGSLAHLEVEALEAAWRKRLQGRRDEYEAALRRVIADGIAEGVFRPVDSKTAVLAILGAVNWTVKWFRPEGAKSARSIGEEFAEQMVRGLLADGAELEVPALELPELPQPDVGDFE
jgi:AcrR family transcriptional regulator